MSDVVKSMLRDEFGILDVHTLDNVTGLGIESLSDFQYATEADLTRVGIAVIKARKILEKYGKKPETKAARVNMSETELFAKLLTFDFGSQFEEFYSFFSVNGEPFIHESLWLNPANDISKLPFEMVFVIRALVGRDPFTSAVIARLLKDQTDDEIIRAVTLFGSDDKTMKEQIRKMANEGSKLTQSDEKMLDVLEAYVSAGLLMRLGWEDR